MSSHSKIEWTDATWNPIRARNLKTGKIGWHCEHATTGCEFCYAEGFNLRLGTGLPFKPGHRKDIEIFLDDKMLLAPLRWKKPRMIFVCSMTDLFADFVQDEWIDKIFAVMALCPQHTFQVLTKRAERMREYIRRRTASQLLIAEQAEIIINSVHMPAARLWELASILPRWPLPNIWLGVSAERQQEADERIPLLRDTPAAVRFISFEPLLGRIEADFTGIHLAIVGGESGAKARPMHPDWARSLRDQCADAGVPFFFKQWGEWLGITEMRRRPDGGGPGFGAYDHRPYDQCKQAIRVGKKAAGRLLDGVEHSGFPEACPQ